jgi:hypothetical protein
MTDKPTADTSALLSRGFDSASGPLTFLNHVGNDDVYHRGPQPGGIIFAIPGLWDSMPADLLAALRARRHASVTGRCPRCDGVAELARSGIAHENGCHAIDDEIRPLLEAWGRRVGRYACGRRITENPA